MLAGLPNQKRDSAHFRSRGILEIFLVIYALIIFVCFPSVAFGDNYSRWYDARKACPKQADFVGNFCTSSSGSIPNPYPDPPAPWSHNPGGYFQCSSYSCLNIPPAGKIIHIHVQGDPIHTGEESCVDQTPGTLEGQNDNITAINVWPSNNPASWEKYNCAQKPEYISIANIKRFDCISANTPPDELCPGHPDCPPDPEENNEPYIPRLNAPVCIGGSTSECNNVQFSWSPAVGSPPVTSWRFRITPDVGISCNISSSWNSNTGTNCSGFKEDGTQYYIQVWARNNDGVSEDAFWNYNNWPKGAPGEPILDPLPNNNSPQGHEFTARVRSPNPKRGVKHFNVEAKCNESTTTTQNWVNKSCGGEKTVTNVPDVVDFQCTGFRDKGDDCQWRAMVGNVLETGRSDNWSEWASFVNYPSNLPEAPEKTGPSEESDQANVNFTWGDTERAKEYRIDIDFINSDGDVETFPCMAAGTFVKRTNVTCNGFPADGTEYEWEITARNARGTTKSETYDFRSGDLRKPLKPNAVFPRASQDDRSTAGSGVLFRWALPPESSKADKYHLLVVDQDGNTLCEKPNILNGTRAVGEEITAFCPSEGEFPDDGSTLLWDVRAYNDAGWSHDFSLGSAKTFVNGPSAPPEATNPTVSSQGGESVFVQWEASKRAQWYKINILMHYVNLRNEPATATFLNGFIVEDNGQDFFKVPISNFLNDDKKYTIQLYACNDYNGESCILRATTDPFINYASVPPLPPVLLQPTSLELGPIGSQVNFQFRESANASNYTIEARRAPDPLAPAEIVCETPDQPWPATQIGCTGNIPPGSVIYWSIQAHNSQGSSPLEFRRFWRTLVRGEDPERDFCADVRPNGITSFGQHIDTCRDESTNVHYMIDKSRQEYSRLNTSIHDHGGFMSGNSAIITYNSLISGGEDPSRNNIYQNLSDTNWGPDNFDGSLMGAQAHIYTGMFYDYFTGALATGGLGIDIKTPQKDGSCLVGQSMTNQINTADFCAPHAVPEEGYVKFCSQNYPAGVTASQVARQWTHMRSNCVSDLKLKLENTDNRLPVVFVHGLNNTGAVFSYLKQHFKKSGWEEQKLISKTLSCPGWLGCSIDGNANEIAGWIDEALSQNPGYDQVILIGFSMGGASTRYYLKQLNAANKVAKYISINGIQQGYTPQDEWRWGLSVCAPPVVPTIPNQLCAEKPFMQTYLQNNSIPHNVPFLAIGHRNDPTVPPHVSQINESLLPSAKNWLTDVNDWVNNSYVNPHSQTLFSPTVANKILEFIGVGNVESYALSESFADFVAASFKSRYGITPNWTMDADVFPGRTMNNPILSSVPQFSTYENVVTADVGGAWCEGSSCFKETVYEYMAIPNLAFYELSSSLDTSIRIGMGNALKIALYAHENFWDNNTNFLGARYSMENAARRLYFDGELNADYTQQVANAWKKVGVGGAFRTPCSGDCDRSGNVTIGELIKMVKIAQGDVTVDESGCLFGVLDPKEKLRVSELVKSVRNHLDNTCSMDDGSGATTSSSGGLGPGNNEFAVKIVHPQANDPSFEIHINNDVSDASSFSFDILTHEATNIQCVQDLSYENVPFSMSNPKTSESGLPLKATRLMFGVAPEVPQDYLNSGVLARCTVSLGSGSNNIMVYEKDSLQGSNENGERVTVVLEGMESSEKYKIHPSLDYSTKGNWNTKGAINDFYYVPTYGDSLIPSLGFSLQNASSWTWTGATTDERAVNLGAARLASIIFNPSQFSIMLNVAQGEEYRASIYMLDWDSYNRKQRVEVIDENTGLVMHSQEFTDFVGGVHFTWDAKGRQRVRITNLNPSANAVVSGIFFERKIGYVNNNEPLFKIHGYTYDTNSVPMSGVKLTLKSNSTIYGTVVSNASGYFEFKDLTPETYQVTPSLAGKAFSPQFETIIVTNSDKRTSDFFGTTGACFIATAAYGTGLEPQINALRDFRDGAMLTSSSGQAAVDWYYHTSPPIADELRKHDGLRKAVRGALMPVVKFSEWWTSGQKEDFGNRFPSM